MLPGLFLGFCVLIHFQEAFERGRPGRSEATSASVPSKGPKEAKDGGVHADFIHMLVLTINKT